MEKTYQTLSALVALSFATVPYAWADGSPCDKVILNRSGCEVGDFGQPQESSRRYEMLEESHIRADLLLKLRALPQSGAKTPKQSQGTNNTSDSKSDDQNKEVQQTEKKMPDPWSGK